MARACQERGCAKTEMAGEAVTLNPQPAMLRIVRKIEGLRLPQQPCKGASMRRKTTCFLVFGTLACLLAVSLASAESAAVEGLTFEQLAATRAVTSVAVSPDGEQIAYTLRVPRTPGSEDDGAAWAELHVLTTDGPSRPFITGEVNLSTVRFTPDGRALTYESKRGDDEHTTLYSLPLSGGESKRLLECETGLSGHRLSPDGKRIAFVATVPESPERESAKENGYTQEIFEEDWLPRRIWIAAADGESPEPKPIEIEGSAFGVEWLPDGTALAATIAPRPLIDDRYMKRRIHIIDVETGAIRTIIESPGKLGAFAVSPDGTKIALISAADPNDPSAGRLMLAPVSGGTPKELLPELAAHVTSLAWNDDHTLTFVTGEGTETRLARLDLRSSKMTTLFVSGSGAPVVTGLAVSAGRGGVALVGETPQHPGEIYDLGADGTPRRRTDSNPWLASVQLGRQEVVKWKSRDGLELEGVLVHPLESKGPAPLILMVHGGPEGHDRNGWVTNYSRPAQLAAARGFASFFPNYRGSTGRGVAFSKLGQGDAAGAEFDDLIDAVDHLIATKVADGERVGITGGSYGGYATAWCSTRYTDRFRAGVMFVGISNKVSKGLTTEIPVEDEMVHTRFSPWTRWKFSLERSPIYHAEKSRTPLLIAHGSADSRVHPSQSLQLYRALKLIGKTPVRYVRYPGEGHGNRRAAARDDYTHRLIRWMEHFLIDGATEAPPWDLALGVEPQETESVD